MPNINQSIEWVLLLQHTKQIENTFFEPFYSRIRISNAVFDLHLQSKHPDSRWNQPNTNAIIWKWDIFRDTFGVQMVQVEISYHSIFIRTGSSCRLLSALPNCLIPVYKSRNMNRAFCQKGWDGRALLGQPSKGHSRCRISILFPYMF